MKDVIKKANETMESLVNYQLMMIAPSPVKEKYFNDVFSSIAAAALTKRLKLELKRKTLEKKLKRKINQKRNVHHQKRIQMMKVLMRMCMAWTIYLCWDAGSFFG